MFFCSNSEQQQQNNNVKKTSLVFPDTEYCISLTNWQLTICCLLRFVLFCLDYSGCGESPVTFRARIVGGRDSERGWWPWQIGIYKLNNKGIETVFFFKFIKKEKYSG